MAFLMNVAASKKGAEDLLDSGVFEQLAMCSFVSVQPMREEIMGELHGESCSDANLQGGAMQDAVDRQHRVLVCALQLLTRVLSSLHRSSRTGAGHVGPFQSSPTVELTRLRQSASSTPIGSLYWSS
jgi:nuclear pore complex protein Nup205